jgi:hypothetical protein
LNRCRGSGGEKLLAVNLILMGNRGRLLPREVSGQRTGAAAERLRWSALPGPVAAIRTLLTTVSAPATVRNSYQDGADHAA